VISGGPGNVTLLLRELKSGKRAKLGQLLELVYPDLRRLAAQQFRAERPGRVLQPTAAPIFSEPPPG